MSVFDIFKSSKTEYNENSSNHTVVVNESLDKSSLSDDSFEYDLLQLSQDNNSVTELLSNLRNLNQSVKALYEEYDNMVSDDIIDSALELYADDATQIFNELNKIVTVESDDPKLVKDIESFFSSIQVDSKIWEWTYELAKYGNFYLKNVSLIDREEEVINKLGYVDNNSQNFSSYMNEARVRNIKVDHRPFKVEEVIDPSSVMDLWYGGERVAFAEEVPEKNNVNMLGQSRLSTGTREVKMYDPRAFTHFSLGKSIAKDRVVLDSRIHMDRLGKPIQLEYTSNRGVSVLESCRLSHRISTLLEDSVIYAKIAKGSFVRVYNVEVGDSTPKKTTNIINRVKSQFHAKSSYNSNSGSYNASLNNRPVADPIFNPVRSGKGGITHEDIGGEIEVRYLEDLEYFRKKKFAGLKVPPAFLGYSEDISGFGQDSMLTQMDIRYSRTVRRIQNALIAGLYDLVNTWYLYNTGNEIDKSKFSIVLQNPSTSEEMSRLKEIGDRVDIISGVVHSITELSDHSDMINSPRITKLMIEKFLGGVTDIDEIVEELDKVSDRVDKVIDDNQELTNTNRSDARWGSSLREEIDNQYSPDEVIEDSNDINRILNNNIDNDFLGDIPKNDI